MTLQISKRKFTDYLLLYLLVAISGIPFFYGDMLMMGVFGLLFLTFLIRKEGVHPFYFFIFFSFLILVLLHALRFNNLPYTTVIGLLVRISLGYFTVVILKDKFTNYYVNIICVLSVLSFIFFIPLFLSSGFESVFNSIAIKAPFDRHGRGSLILYHLNFDRPGGLYRNCGPFWEPAAFGGFLLIAFMFNLARTNSLKDKRSIILLITLFSTFSTTVFVVLGLMLFFYFIFNQGLLVKLTLVPIFAIGFYIAFYNVDFLYDKIMEEVKKGDKQEAMKENETAGHTRLSSGIADYRDFIKYPVIGRGMYDLTFYNPHDYKTRHNGLTDFIAQFGIIGSLIYFISIYTTFKKLVLYSHLKHLMRFVFFGVIILIGISEGYFNKPFFWALVFLHLVIQSRENVLQNEPAKEQVAVA